MQCDVHGSIAQYARLTFGAGEQAWTSRGSIVAYSGGIDWELRIPGGLSGAARRGLAGEGISLTSVESRNAGEHVLVAANAPGHIIEWDLADGAVLATRGAFLAAWGDDIRIDVTVAKRAGAAFFGGAGLFLQKISGVGTALIHTRGDFRDVHLAEGERLSVSTGNLVALAESVDYDIQGVGGIRKMLFGREGVFMTKVTGPGRILLQSLKSGSDE